MTTPLEELLSDLTEPISRMVVESHEAQSTEEVLRMISEANLRLKQEGVSDMALGSMDVVALYLSLDQKRSAEIVAEAIIESDVRYSGVEMDIASVYLATIWSKERKKKEGVFRLLPRKKSTRGRKSTVNSKE